MPTPRQQPKPANELEQALVASRADPFSATQRPEMQPLAPPVEVMQPVEPTPERDPDSRMPSADIRCPCGEVLVHIAPGGAAVLHVYERLVLRPHVLAESDLPLVWHCSHCGQETIIG